MADEWAARLVAGEAANRAVVPTALLLEALVIREVQVVEGVAAHRPVVRTVLRLAIREVPVEGVVANSAVVVAQTALVPLIREIPVEGVTVHRAVLQTVLLPDIRGIPVEDIRVGGRGHMGWDEDLVVVTREA